MLIVGRRGLIAVYKGCRGLKEVCSGWEGLITVHRAYNRSAEVRRRGREVYRGFKGLKEGIGGYRF